MEKKDLIIGVVGLAVCVIVAATVLMPILSDATKTEDTFTNEGLWRMKPIENGDEWVKSGSTVVYNTDDVLSYGNNGLLNIALGDDWCVRANGNARGSFVRSSSTAATVLAADDVITISGSGIISTNTPPITGYGFCSTGEYTLTSTTVAPYVNADSPIYATGVTFMEGGATDIVCHFEGSIEDGITITNIDPYGSTPYDSVVFSDVVIDYEQVTSHVDLYKINKITFTATTTLSDDVNEVPITYTSYVVPYQVTAEKSQHLDSGSIAIINAIPIIIIVAMITMAVGFFLVKRE